MRSASANTARFGRSSPGLDPAHVQQVRDQPVQPLGLAIDGRRRSPGAGPAGHSTSGSMSVPAAARIEASGVRRSCETESSSADLSASLRREISADVASRGVGRARATRRSGRRPRRGPGLAASGSPSSRGRTAQMAPRARRRVAIGDPIGGARVGAALGLRRCAVGGVHADPFGRLVARLTAQHGVRPPVRRAPVARRAIGVGRDRSPTIDPDARRAESRSRQHRGRSSERRRRDRVRLGEREADTEQRPRLALAFDRRHGPVALPAGQPADHDADDEQQDEVQPLARVVDRRA